MSSKQVRLPQKAALLVYIISLLPHTGKLNADFASVSAAPVTYSVSRYNASLLGLDIPLNLKYNISQRKNDVYLTAGVSSNFFLDEEYTYSYQVNNPGGFAVAGKNDDSSEAKLENFDFARMLNFSFGFGRQLTKQSKLSFEPFVKYPLGGQGAQNLRFGAAGMNLKLNFSKPNKK